MGLLTIVGRHRRYGRMSGGGGDCTTLPVLGTLICDASWVSTAVTAVIICCSWDLRNQQHVCCVPWDFVDFSAVVDE